MSQQFDAYNSDFIGRQDELDLFDEWVKNIEQHSLLYFHDGEAEKDKQGGIGKTSLLREFFVITQKQYTNFIPVMLDFFTIEARNGVFVANTIIKAIQQRYRTWTPSSYHTLLDDYYRALNGKSRNIVSIRQQMGDALASDLAAIQPLMERDKSYILLFFDTFEFIQDNPKTAILSSLPRFPDYYHFDRFRSVVAGRNTPVQSHLDWQWQETLRSYPLLAFSSTEVEQYMQINVLRMDFSQQTLKHIRTLTDGGRPILLALMTEILNRQNVTVEKLMQEPRRSFEQMLALQTQSFSYPLNWSLLFMTHIYHRFNEEVLRDIFKGLSTNIGSSISELDYENTVSILKSFPFVRTASMGKDFVLHDEMRRLMRVYCWPSIDPEGSLRIHVSTIAIQRYDVLLENETNEEILESYLVEMLYHKLFINVNEGLNFFYEHFDKAISLSQTDFAHNLLEEVKKFHRETSSSFILEERQYQLSPEQLDNLKFAEAELLLEDDAPKAALQLYEELENNTSWAEQHASDLRYEKANSYFKAEMYPEAIKTYEECLQLFQISNIRTSDIYNTLGLIARKRADFPLAVAYYQKSLDFLKVLDIPQRRASTLNNLGNIYRLSGNFDKGLLCCRRALQIREELFQRKQLGQLPVGLSHSTLALMYHTMGRLAEEESHCETAFQIFESLGSKVYLSGAWVARGRVWMNKNNQEQALVCFEEAYRLSRGINKEVEIESLNQIGRVYRSQMQWQKALEHFTQAVTFSREVDQRFSLVENLTYLVDVLDNLGRSASKELEEAMQLAPNKFSKAQVEETLGDISYRKNDYLQAFIHYAIACKLSAQYNRIEYTKKLGRLENNLLNLSRTELSAVVLSLLQYWDQENLNQIYPEFRDLCKNILDF